jgi:hypothetical protein
LLKRVYGDFFSALAFAGCSFLFYHQSYQIQVRTKKRTLEEKLREFQFDFYLNKEEEEAD